MVGHLPVRMDKKNGTTDIIAFGTGGIKPETIQWYEQTFDVTAFNTPSTASITEWRVNVPTGLLNEVLSKHPPAKGGGSGRGR